MPVMLLSPNYKTEVSKQQLMVYHYALLIREGPDKRKLLIKRATDKIQLSKV